MYQGTLSRISSQPSFLFPLFTLLFPPTAHTTHIDTMSGDTTTASSDITYFIGDPRVPSMYKQGALHTINPQSDPLGPATRYVCIENIPKFITPPEILGHLAGYREDVAGLRVLGCVENKAQYLLMMDLGLKETAVEVRDRHHGRQFSALGSEVMYISIVSECTAAPLFSHDTSEGIEQCPVCLEPLVGELIRTPPIQPSQSPPTYDLGSSPIDVGLPLGMSTGSATDSHVLWTTMCGHTAHFQCILSHNHGTGCPVCRFNPADLGVECSEEGCTESDTLWMCLVCGHLGCGRYQRGHAEQHFSCSGHTYALDVASGSVWDYDADNFVHRLIARGSDGQLESVGKKNHFDESELEEGISAQSQNNIQVIDSKMQMVSDTYAQLLDTQLSTQQVYYAGLLAKDMKQKGMLSEKLQSLKDVEQEGTKEIEALDASLRDTKKKNAKLAKKNDTLTEKVALIQDELDTEKAMNTQVKTGIEKFEAKLAQFSKTSDKVTKKKAERDELQAKLMKLMGQLDM